MKTNLYLGDCINILANTPENSIDLIVTDVPWGDTKQEFDKPVDTAVLMELLRKVVKPSGKIVIISNMRYGAKLVVENDDIFKQHRVWKHRRARNFQNSSHQALIYHYDMFIFYKDKGTYNPILTTGHKPVNSFTKRTGNGSNYGKMDKEFKGGGQTTRKPSSIIDIPYKDVRKVAKDEGRKQHPQEKPVELYQYIIKTYSNELDIVCDCFFGSCNSGIAAVIENRNFIGMELNSNFYNEACERIKKYEV